MSSALAYSETAPLRRPSEQPRHVQIVSTRAQRQARPRVVYAVLALGGLFGLFLLQLVLSIVIAGGAYQISDLQVQQRELVREQDALVETLNLLGSPQNIATKAESLGMMLGTSTPAFLRLADGAVVGSHLRTSPGRAVLGSKGNLVPNILLTQMAAAEEQPGLVVADKGAATIAPASSSAATAVETLPSPVTR